MSERKPLLARWSVRIPLALLVLAVAGYFARNFIVRKSLEAGVTEVTGFPLAIDSFSLGLLDSKVDVRGMRLSNPPGFEDPRCLSVGRLAADVELLTFFVEELHIEEIDLAMDEVVVVRNASGETNFDRLKALGGEGGEKKPAAGEPAGKEPAPASKQRKWRCDRLHLRLPRVVLLDYGSMRNGKPKQEVFDIKVDEEFRNIHGPEQIVKILTLKVLTRTPIKLLRVSASSLTESLGDAIGGAARGIEKGIGGALDGILGGDDKKSPPPPKKAPPPPPKKPGRK